MDYSRILYYTCILTSLIICCYYSLYNKSIRIFIFLFLLSIVTEILSDKTRTFLFYHFYIPLEYFFLSYFFKQKWNEKAVKNIIQVSAICFAIFCIIISATVRKINEFPSIQFNVEGVFNIALSLSALLFIPVDEKLPIYRLPVFWISLALLLFHSGIFVLNGSYNYLLQHNPYFANKLTRIINYNLNILYYILFSIAFICSKRTAK